MAAVSFRVVLFQPLRDGKIAIAESGPGRIIEIDRAGKIHREIKLKVNRRHPHTDTRWKGITVQLFLPRDASHTDIGTIFHEKLADGSLLKRTQMKFAPNSGYAFAVGEDTWHSADRVGPEVTTRDSILHTYFVDAGPLRVLRNRGKRIANFLRNELRHYAPR